VFGDHDLKAASAKIYKILNRSLSYLQDRAPEEWARRQSDKGLITVPNGVNAILSVFGDLIHHLLKQEVISATKSSADEICSAIEEYLDVVSGFYKNLSLEQRQKLASEKGGGAPIKIQNTIRLAINESFKDFKPEGLETFIKQQDSQFNDETLRMCGTLERDFRQRVQEKLMNEMGSKDWRIKGVPKKIWDKITEMHTDALREEQVTDENSEPWDFTDFSDLRTVIIDKWTLFEKDFMFPGSGNASKAKKTEWIVRLKDIRNPLAHNRGNALEEDFRWVEAIEEWQINNNAAYLKELSE
jgi:DNA sulfur modification protein DndB